MFASEVLCLQYGSVDRDCKSKTSYAYTAEKKNVKTSNEDIKINKLKENKRSS